LLLIFGLAADEIARSRPIDAKPSTDIAAPASGGGVGRSTFTPMHWLWLCALMNLLCFAADIADPKTNSVPKLRQRMMEDQARLLELEKQAGDGRSYAAVVASLADKEAAAAAAGAAGAGSAAAAGDQAATKFPDGSSRCVRLSESPR
jgi:hypothetical protein